jgi:hypothetical protein
MSLEHTKHFRSVTTTHHLGLVSKFQIKHNLFLFSREYLVMKRKELPSISVPDPKHTSKLMSRLQTFLPQLQAANQGNDIKNSAPSYIV